MAANKRGSGVESRLLDLLEYRQILGAIITTSDGLLVANCATSIDDAEQLAVTAVAASQPGDGDATYWEASSKHGMIHVVNGSDLRLIALSDPDIEPDLARPLLTEHLLDIEHMIQL